MSTIPTFLINTLTKACTNISYLMLTIQKVYSYESLYLSIPPGIIIYRFAELENDAKHDALFYAAKHVNRQHKQTKNNASIMF